MNTDTKSLLASKTLWGVLIAALPSLAKFFGYDIADVAGFTAGANELVDGVITLVGSALAIYGRATATAKLVVKKS
jgi:hypothetical protein